MKKKLATGLFLGFISFVLPTAAIATVLTFDDVSSTNSYVPIPDGYGGLDWNMVVIYKNLHPGSGYDLGRVSGDYTAWHHQPASVSVSTGTFDFTGAYFASAWDASLDIVLEGWSSSVQLFTDTITVNNQGPTWFGAGYSGIDELRIVSQGQQFVMDNFTFNENDNGGEVPEPATLALMGLGLAGIGWRRKKAA